MNHLLQFVRVNLNPESCRGNRMRGRAYSGSLQKNKSRGTITSCSSRHVLALHMALSLALSSELLFKDCAMYIASPDLRYDLASYFQLQLSDEF
jgi:hypothetical protein